MDTYKGAIARAVNIAALRRAHNISQVQLAHMLDRTNIHLSRIERGESAIPMPLALDIVMLFGDPVEVEYKGRRFLVVPKSDSAPTDDHPKPRRDPFAALNDTERIVRLGKEIGDVQACTNELPRCLLNPQARREYVKRLLKEGIEADMILEALLAAADPALLAEAAAMSEAELEAEMGMSA